MTKQHCVHAKPTHRQLSNTHSVVDECSSERLLGVTINNDLS